MTFIDEWVVEGDAVLGL